LLLNNYTKGGKFSRDVVWRRTELHPLPFCQIDDQFSFQRVAPYRPAVIRGGENRTTRNCKSQMGEWYPAAWTSTLDACTRDDSMPCSSRLQSDCHADLNKLSLCHGGGEQAPAVSNAGEVAVPGAVWSDIRCLKIATRQRDVTLERLQTAPRRG